MRKFEAYLPACGILARFSNDKVLPVLCWGLTETDELRGLVHWKNRVVIAEEMGGVWGGPGSFEGYESAFHSNPLTR